MRLTLRLDTDSIPEEQAKILQTLLEKASFFDLTSQNKPENLPDCFSYTVQVENEQKKQSVRFSESSAPHSLRPLLQVLTEEAKKHGGNSK